MQESKHAEQLKTLSDRSVTTAVATIGPSSWGAVTELNKVTIKRKPKYLLCSKPSIPHTLIMVTSVKFFQSLSPDPKFHVPLLW